MNKLKELYFYYSKKGALETIKRIRQRYFRTSTFILLKKNLTKESPRVLIDSSFSCIEGNLDRLREERQKKTDLPREFYIDQSHGGNKFYCVYIDNQLAYIHWYFIKGGYSRFFNIHDATTVELNYNYTLPEYRGNRLSSKSINYICEDLRKKSFHKVVSAVSCGNILAINGLRRNNFYEIKKVKSYCSLVKKTKV